MDASATSGPSAARNIGAEAAAGDLLAFCDADDVVGPGWLAVRCARHSRMRTLREASSSTASLNGRRRDTPVACGDAPARADPGRLAANLGVRRAAFEALGGFDEDLRVGEDVDLCWRLQFAGYRFAFSSRAVVSKRDRGDGDRSFATVSPWSKRAGASTASTGVTGYAADSRGVAKAWGWLVVEISVSLRRDLRRRWLRAAGVRIGRILGSVENGVFFPENAEPC